MAWRSPKQILALLLAVLVTAGLSVSVVQANGMAVAMAMAHDMNAAVMPDMGEMPAMGHAGGCAACAKGAGDNGTAMHCPLACTTPVLAVLPQEPAVTTLLRTPHPSASPSPLLLGRNALPDPSPPRPSDLV
jgi:hypothetical protein